MLGMLTVVTLTQSFLVTEHVACIEDKIFTWTTAINQFFINSPPAKHAYMIICGLLMDIMVLGQFYRFAMHGTTWRFPMCLVMFYAFRALMQVSFSVLTLPVNLLHAFPRWVLMGLPRVLLSYCSLWQD
jgi:hypothetical protein